jgi:putative hemolysin
VSDFLRVIIVLLLVLGTAIFVAAEYALVTARRTRLEQMDSLPARRALRLMDEPVRFISTIQVGITIFGIAMGSFGEPLISGYFDPWLSHALAYLLSFLILTYLTVVLGELVPKAVALQRAEALAVVLAVPLDVLARITAPLVWVLQNSANAVSRLFGVEPAAAGVHGYTREDILYTVREAEDTGVIQEAEEEMLYKVFDFADKEVHEVMVPRPEVVAISVELPPEECLAAVIDSPYTRYPAYKGSLDDIVGILHVRDLFSALNDRGIANVVIEEILRPAFVVPETKDLAALLADFRRTKNHMAIVIDEYGAMQGLITLEDVLEELVGEIEDEFDPRVREVIRRDGDGLWIDGAAPVRLVGDSLRVPVAAPHEATIGGHLIEELGRVPGAGEVVRFGRAELEVVDVDDTRIVALRSPPREASSSS